MTMNHDDSAPALAGAIRCILRDIGRAVGAPLDDLPGKFDTGATAAILDLTTPRTLDTWASRPDRGGLPFVKVGRSRRYLLTDLVTFMAKRHSDAGDYAASAISSAVYAEVSRLGEPAVTDAA